VVHAKAADFDSAIRRFESSRPSQYGHSAIAFPSEKSARPIMDINDRIHAQLVKAGVSLAATLPDDWVNGLIRRVAPPLPIAKVASMKLYSSFSTPL
jgi:hypothetical protein